MSSRYVLVDYQHLAHRCIVAEPLHTTVSINGIPTVVDTTIPNYTIKDIHRYGGKGRFYTGVFFEGGNSERKAHFSGGSGTGEGYKGNRDRKGGAFYDGIELAIQLMHNGQVSLYRQQGYEADDLIGAMVKKIKEVDTITPIDIITNDSDLLPFVDDQVSVYMRGKRQYAEDGCLEHRLYYQVTPRSWDDYLSYTSAYRDFRIPYNSMLLFKLIRGDKADNYIGACKGYGGKKYTELMYRMESDGVDFANIFRYGLDFNQVMRPVLEQYITNSVAVLGDDGRPVEISAVDYMEYIYRGINPKPIVEGTIKIPRQIELGYLQSSLQNVRINLL